MDRLATIVALQACGRHTWAECAEFMGERKEAIRSLHRRRPEGVEVDPCPICGEILEEQRGTRWSEKGNYAEAAASAESPLSLEEFEDLLRVDRTKWRTLDWEAKRWQVGAKIKVGHLEWEDGRLTGELDYRGLGKEDLWSHWARFVRRQPVALEPVVSPVKCPQLAGPVVPRERGVRAEGSRDGLLLADPHFGYERNLRTGKLRPFHDRRTLDLVVQVVELWRPEYIGILGDLLDLTMWTDKFARSPEFYWTTQPAILEAHLWLRRLREAAPGAEIVHVGGNHEARMQKMLEAHLIEACHLRAADELHLPPALSVPRLLALHQLGIRWVAEDDPSEYLGVLRLDHGDRASSVPGGTARANADNNDEHCASGHIHRSEHVTRRSKTRSGWRMVRAWCIPCLCHTDGRVPGSSPDQNWQQGFAQVQYTEDRYTLTPVDIVDGAALAGQLFQGQDYTEELRRALPDWNW